MSNFAFPADRDVRQRGLVPPARLADAHAMVVGVGAIGRQVALQLAALGVPRLSLFDPDTVGVENLAPQGYWPDDIGHAKVDATARLCRRILPEMEITAIRERFRRSAGRILTHVRDSYVFVCVDAIDTRRFVFEAVRHRSTLFVDGRMAAEVVRVIAVEHPSSAHWYLDTLFSSLDAYAGSCTSRSTIYSASVAAGLMLGQFTRFLRGQSVIADQMLNILAGELTVAETAAA